MDEFKNFSIHEQEHDGNDTHGNSNRFLTQRIATKAISDVFPEHQGKLFNVAGLIDQ
jgi:hypothetical protein